MIPSAQRRPTKDEQFEAQARALQAEGYRGGVVARKMIDEHGMEEAAALALIARIYGTKVNPRAGETTEALVGGSVRIVLGLAGAFLLFMRAGLSIYSIAAYAGLFGTAGYGAKMVILALINADVKEDPKR